MAHVQWSAGIDFVSGALSKPSKNSQHSHEKMLLATHRTAATTNPKCNRIYLREKPTRTSPVTADEQVVRNRFAQVSRAVNQRRNDLSKIAGDLAGFNAQKDNPNGKKTMRSYLWMVCDAEIG
ncbi:MAG: hypothetical protein IJS92_06130 [Paludibacteraceae bacterium]|nr:hypothetical protein [Paludibacteraceae bacterium]